MGVKAVREVRGTWAGRHKGRGEMRFITILSRNDASNGRGSVRADLYLLRRVGAGERPFKLLIKAGRED